jgi:hypothetical protein
MDDWRLENLRWATPKMITSNLKGPNREFLNELPKGFHPFTQYSVPNQKQNMGVGGLVHKMAEVKQDCESTV